MSQTVQVKAPNSRTAVARAATKCGFGKGQYEVVGKPKWLKRKKKWSVTLRKKR